MVPRGAFAMAILLTGCSLAFVRGPDDTPPGTSSCTISQTVPSIDFLLGGAIAISGVALAAVADSGNGNGGGRFEVFVLVSIPALVVGATYIVSGALGYRRVVRCRDRRLAVPAQ